MDPSIDTTPIRFLTFTVDAQLYALRAEEVAEVIRVPALARIPQAPAALLGVANLRGSVLPIASMRELLGKPAGSAAASDARAIVLDLGAPIAVLVDAVQTLETITQDQIETRKKELSAQGGEKLLGAFAVSRSQSVAKILDIKPLLERAFASRAKSERRSRSSKGESITDAARHVTTNTEMLVTFEVAGQEFALPLEAVREILPVPPVVAAVARAETVVVGMTSVRDTLLPLLSLRSLLGFSNSEAAEEGLEKVVVMNVAGAQVGLIADNARSVLAADVQYLDPIPPVLAARTGGEARIKSIYRGEGGRRLISILSPEQLFREDVMQRLAADAKSANSQSSAPQQTSAELIFLVFRLGEEEFGLPIETVVEVAQVPDQITRLPKTPKFLEGIVNLRGDVLPVIDQRRRFDMPKAEQLEGRRLVVIRTERHRAGLIVDSVSDVLRTRAENIEPPPDLTEATSRLVRGVINLEDTRRMVLLLDPTEVLTRAEQGLLDSFQAASKKANA